MQAAVRARKLILTIAVAAQLSVGCGSSPGDRGAATPEPLAAAGVVESQRVERPADTPPPSTTPDSTPPDSTAPVSTAPGSTAIVAEVLDRYDAALTAIAADPLGAGVGGDQRMLAWIGAVAPNSPLHADVLRPLVTDAATDGIVVTPDGHEYSWRHVPVGASDPVGGRISFTWCGWSPGVVRRGAGGTVLDDEVGISAGVGELVFGSGWQLDSLERMELSVHPPGTPDPCGGSAP